MAGQRYLIWNNVLAIFNYPRSVVTLCGNEYFMHVGGERLVRIWRRLERWNVYRLARSGKVAQAYRICRKLVEKDPCDGWVHLMLAGLEMDVNSDAARAEYHLAEARRLPGCIMSDWYHMHGHMLFQQQQVEAAAQEYEKAVDLDRSTLNLHCLAAALMPYDRSRAKPIWEEILTKVPKHAPAYASLAAIAGEKDDAVSEITLAAKASTIDPTDPYVREVLQHARCAFLSLRELGRLAETTAVSGIAHSLWPNDPDIIAELDRLAREK